MKRVHVITTTNVDTLLRGASVLACGGGLSYKEQQQLIRSKRLQAALKIGIPLLSPSEIPTEALCVTVSEIGAASAPVMKKDNLPQAKKLFEEKTGQQVYALIPGEIGQEAILLESAAILHLPVVDADLSGCRAVPRLTDLALIVQGVPFTMSPLVVLDKRGKLTFIPKQPTLDTDETKVRSLVKRGEVVTLFGSAVTGALMRTYLNYHSYSRALAVGSHLELPTTCLFGPTESVVQSIVEQEDAGFSKKNIELKTRDGDPIQVLVENEYMSLTVKNQVFAFPQLIMMLDPEERRGVHSSELTVGKKVTLVVADAFYFWKGTSI